MVDANDNEEASLADDFEEATYDGNDETQPEHTQNQI